MRQELQSRLATLVACTVILSCGASASLAQGSTGGTLGKTDQSLSGDQPQPQPPAVKTAPPKRSAATQPQAEKKGGCPSIVGVWNSWASGLFGNSDTTFRRDGSAAHTSTNGKWWCDNGKLIIQWSGGEPHEVRLHADGKKVSLTNGQVVFSR